MKKTKDETNLESFENNDINKLISRLKKANEENPYISSISDVKNTPNTLEEKITSNSKTKKIDEDDSTKTSSKSRSKKTKEDTATKASSKSRAKKSEEYIATKASSKSRAKKSEEDSNAKASSKSRTKKAKEDVTTKASSKSRAKKAEESVTPKASSKSKKTEEEIATKPSSKSKVKKAKEDSTTKVSSSSKTKKAEEDSTIKTSSKSKKSDENTDTKFSSISDIPQPTSTTNLYRNPDVLKLEERLRQAQNLSNSKIINSHSNTNKIKDKDKDKDKVKDKVKVKVKQKNKDKDKDKDKTKVKDKSNSKTKIKTKSKKKNLLYNIIIFVCIVSIIYSSGNILLWHKNNVDSNKIIEKVTESTPIVTVEQLSLSEDVQIEKKSYDFSNLLSQNSDTVGWISIPNTEINYPVVKGNDNEFYLKHDFEKNYNAAGWIYSDFRNNCDGLDSNLIIYGHNRLNNNMFGTLENTLNKDWVSTPENPFITFSDLNNSHIYKMFSVFICDASESVDYLITDFQSKDDYYNYIQNIKNKSQIEFDTNLTKNDKIITLYTCHGLNNERLIVFGKLII